MEPRTPGSFTTIGARRQSVSLWDTPATPANQSDTDSAPRGAGRASSAADNDGSVHRRCASTRRRRAPGRTSGTCGARRVRCWPRRPTSGETATGWQQVNCSTAAIHVPRARHYVVSYHAPNGVLRLRRPVLQTRGSSAARSRAGGRRRRGNGVYAFGPRGLPERAPTTHTNYWVDVVFDTSRRTRCRPTVTTWSRRRTSSGGRGRRGSGHLRRGRANRIAGLHAARSVRRRRAVAVSYDDAEPARPRWTPTRTRCRG